MHRLSILALFIVVLKCGVFVFVKITLAFSLILGHNIIIKKCTSQHALGMDTNEQLLIIIVNLTINTCYCPKAQLVICCMVRKPLSVDV